MEKPDEQVAIKIIQQEEKIVGYSNTVNDKIYVPTNEMEQLQILIDSKALPKNITTIEKAYAYAQYGKELGLKPMQAFHQLFDINGRLAPSAKALGGMLWTNGIQYQTIADYEIQVTGVKTDGTEIKQRVTTIKFYRGKIEETVSMYWNDAVKAGWTTKDNWEKMPKWMLWARCLSIGANRIAPDITLGMYTVEELVDITNNKNTKIDEEGNITLEI